MRLVVIFTTEGDYECGGCDIVLPIVYESPEAFIVHLQDSIDKYNRAKKEYAIAIVEHYKKEPKIKVIRNDELKGVIPYEEKWLKWRMETPKEVPFVINVGKYEFSNYFDSASNIKLPRILTVDEWYGENL